jgi:hypothetical protein
LEAQDRVVGEHQDLLGEGAQVVGEQLPVGIEVDRRLLVEEAHQQLGLADLPPPVHRDQFGLSRRPPAFELRQFTLPIEKHTSLSYA